MENFLFMQEKARELSSIPDLAYYSGHVGILSKYPYIREFGRQKFNKVVPGSLREHYNKGIEICHVTSGRYHWQVEGKEYTLYPDDCFVTCPFEKHGSIKGHLDIGVLTWIIINPERFEDNGDLVLGDWCGLGKKEQLEMGEILIKKGSHKFVNNEIKKIIKKLHNEIYHDVIFSSQRTGNLVEALLIETCRSLHAMNTGEITPPAFVERLTAYVMENIMEPITLDALSAEFNLSASSLNERVKNFTGYSPINYVTSLRLEKAKQLLLESDKNITCIAHDCGFYSSQYFSDTFKKWNGISPGKYREKGN